MSLRKPTGKGRNSSRSSRRMPHGWKALPGSIRSSVSGCGFEKREEEHGAAYYFTKFESVKMDDYQTIRKNAVESEQLGFKVFVLRQKLKLLGVDSSIKDWEAGIIE